MIATVYSAAVGVGLGLVMIAFGALLIWRLHRNDQRPKPRIEHKPESDPEIHGDGAWPKRRAF